MNEQEINNATAQVMRDNGILKPARRTRSDAGTHRPAKSAPEPRRAKSSPSRGIGCRLRSTGGCSFARRRAM